MMEELVSVIVPVFNAEKYIIDALKTIQTQTYKNIQIIIVNDGSTDGTQFLCTEAANKDSRIELYTIVNGGVSNARNFGIKKAKGDWIIFVDADDSLENNCIETAIRYQNEKNADIVCYNGIYVSESNTTKMNPFQGSENHDFECDDRELLIRHLYRQDGKYYFGDYFRAVWGKLLSAAIIKNNNILFPENIKIGEDALFLMEYFYFCHRCFFMNEYLYHYRVSNESVMGKYKRDYYDNKLDEFEMAVKKFESYNIDYRAEAIHFWIESEKELIRNELKKDSDVNRIVNKLYPLLNQNPSIKYLAMTDRNRGIKSFVRSVLFKIHMGKFALKIDTIIVKGMKNKAKKIYRELGATIVGNNIKCILKYRRKKFNYNNDKIHIIFLVERTNVWNSVKSIYDAAIKNNNIKVYLIALQPFKNDSIDKDDNSVYEFCKKINSNALKAYDKKNDSYMDLSSVNPDYIFLNVPYETEYPECYSFEKLAKLARLCYSAYGYTMKRSRLQNITVRSEIMKYVSYIFCCNDIMYNYYRQRMMLSELIRGRRLYNIGFPRFDLFRDLSESKTVNKKIMWLPRWTTAVEVQADGNEPSSFFELKDKILYYMLENSDTELIIRPHPKAFENYIKHNMMTELEVEEYRNRIDKTDNISFDNNPSYYENLIKADIIIADFTSMLAEYFVTGRPVIYLGNGDNYPPEHIGMYNSFYHAACWEDVERYLNELKQGIDSKKEQREQAVIDFLKDKPRNVGKHIVNILIENYRKKR